MTSSFFFLAVISFRMAIYWYGTPSSSKKGTIVLSDQKYVPSFALFFYFFLPYLSLCDRIPKFLIYFFTLIARFNQAVILPNQFFSTILRDLTEIYRLRNVIIPSVSVIVTSAVKCKADVISLNSLFLVFN